MVEQVSPRRQHFFRDHGGQGFTSPARHLRRGREEPCADAGPSQFHIRAVLGFSSPIGFVPVDAAERIVLGDSFGNEFANGPGPQPDPGIQVLAGRLISFLQMIVDAAVEEPVLTGDHLALPGEPGTSQPAALKEPRRQRGVEGALAVPTENSGLALGGPSPGMKIEEPREILPA